MREDMYLEKQESTDEWNNVFVHEPEKIIYVPAYLRVIVKRVKDIDFEKL